MVDRVRLVLYRANKSYVITRLKRMALARSRAAHMYHHLPSRTTPPYHCAMVRRKLESGDAEYR
jgi:hypothetical protein